MIGMIGAVGAAGVMLNPAARADAKPPPPPAVDLITFAHGALPVAATIDGKAQGVELEGLVRASDGSPGRFTLVRSGDAKTVVELVYELPAPTTFTAFAVPDVAEVPSKHITFVRQVEVHGSAAAPDRGFALLASATLAPHARPDERTALTMAGGKPAAVRWVKVRLSGGLDLPAGKATLQFSELIGHGRQDASPLASHFAGVWKGRGVLIELQQQGATVTGCYDSDGGELSGTVSGNLLRAVGVDPGDKVKSSFILAVGSDGALRGLRSTNGAPFRPYQGPVAPAGTRTTCSAPPPRLGCGAIIHAINFDFDSATIRPESAQVLTELHAGLAGERTATIVIEGHTSSEGAVSHNLELSRRRAQAVVDELVRRGLDRKRIRATGKGSARPLAPNSDETGRSMNRRVEVQCT